MIGKIKGVFNLKEELDTLNKELQDNKNLVKELSELFKKELSELKEIKENQIDFLNQFKIAATQVKEELKSELSQFQAINKGLQNQVLAKFEKETIDYFNRYNDEIKLNKDNYEKLKQDLESAAQKLISMNTEITKLVDISQNIKKQDFELAQFSQKIFEEDKNKLELMKKIDELERLMARMQRNRR